MNRSLAEGRALKSFAFTRSGVSDAFSVLLDHPVRPVQHGLRNRDANLLARLQVDDQLKLLGCSIGKSAAWPISCPRLFQQKFYPWAICVRPTHAVEKENIGCGWSYNRRYCVISSNNGVVPTDRDGIPKSPRRVIARSEKRCLFAPSRRVTLENIRSVCGANHGEIPAYGNGLPESVVKDLTEVITRLDDLV